MPSCAQGKQTLQGGGVALHKPGNLLCLKTVFKKSIVSRFYIKRSSHLFTGAENAATTVCTDGSHHPRGSSRPKRKLKSNSAHASSVPEDLDEEPERQRHNSKRVKRDKPSAVDAAALPSKGACTDLLGRL